jgi:hypothetical protein
MSPDNEKAPFALNVQLAVMSRIPFEFQSIVTVVGSDSCSPSNTRVLRIAEVVMAVSIMML